MEILISFLIIIALLRALFVISAANPIHSVFSLIGLFIRSTRLLFTLHADFLGILLLVVYVGAIAVLFLFVIMMLHLNLITIQTNNLLRYLPITIIIRFLFLFNFFYLRNNFRSNDLININFTNYIGLDIHSINIFADVLYSKYFRYFIIRSLILFVAMIGAIVITQESNSIKYLQSKKQNTNNQLIRKTIR